MEQILVPARLLCVYGKRKSKFSCLRLGWQNLLSKKYDGNSSDVLSHW